MDDTIRKRIERRIETYEGFKKIIKEIEFNELVIEVSGSSNLINWCDMEINKLKRLLEGDTKNAF